MDALNKWLDGKKTVIGGVGLFLGALSALCMAIQAHGLNFGDVVVALKGIGVAMVALGFGGKLQKLIDGILSSK